MRVLFVTEASFLKTGYAIYSRNILSRLQKDGFEIAELGVYSADIENRAKKVPWVFYSNLPAEHELQSFNSNGSNHYGRFRFEEAVCDFKPHVVCTIRDIFMDDFVYYSPLRDKYKWITMAPLDGIPQQPEWINICQNVDSLLTYTDWGRDYLSEYGIKSKTASPAASECYFPYKESDKIKEAFNLGGKKIIGSIMRNQPRKLFEVLIAGFAQYIKKYNDNNALLYLHTSVPDVGFNLVKLLFEHGVMSKTLFTYSCGSCKKNFPMYFGDYLTWCPACKQKNVKTSDIYTHIKEEDMNKIINMFDIYVQPACREGFGMPQVEAAACGIPIITTPYAGMMDIKNKIYDCAAMEISAYKLATGMHQYEAAPTPESLCEEIHKNIDKKEANQDKIRESFEKHYSSWDKVYEVWKEEILKTNQNNIDQKQLLKYNIVTDVNINIKQNFLEFSKEIITTFLGPRFLNTHLHYRIIRDLNQGYTINDVNNYIVQHFDGNSYHPFDKNIAIEVLTQMAERRFFWERRWNESITNNAS